MRGWRRHWVFVAVLAVGAVLRVLTHAAFRPAMWYNDSFEYLGIALRWRAYLVRPNGYSAYLWLLEPVHSIGAVTASQHLMGLGVATAGYALLVHRGVRPGLAASASALILVNPYQVQMEHLVMSDMLFMALVVAAVVSVLWADRPGVTATGAAGLLLAAAGLTRSLGPPLIAVVGVYLVVRRVGWRPAVTFLGLATLPLVAYGAWFHAQHGVSSISSSEGIFLYSRVIIFADCTKMHLPDRLRPLCEHRPVEDRVTVSSNYIWRQGGPLDRIPLSRKPQVEVPEDRFDPARNAAARDFAIHAIRAQPGDYVRVVLQDVARTFAWRRDVFPHAYTYRLYEFSTTPFAPPPGRVFILGGTWQDDLREYAHGDARTRTVQPYANWIITYQRRAALPGPLLAGIYTLAFGGISIRRGRDRRRPVAALLLTVSAALLALPAMTAQFDHRYVLPAIPFAAWSAALGVSMLLPRLSTQRPAATAETRTSASRG